MKKTCRQGMGTSLALTRSEASNTLGTWGLQQESGRDSSLGPSEGEAKKTKEAKACEQSRLCMVVVGGRRRVRAGDTIQPLP
jgi:hypothetical protein